MTPCEKLEFQVKAIRTWIEDNTALDRKIESSILPMMLWLSREAELQSKDWLWVLEKSRVHLASSQKWQTRVRKTRGVVPKNAAIIKEIQALPLLPASSGRPGNVLKDLARGYGMKASAIDKILRRKPRGDDRVSPERARSLCLGRPQARGQKNPKWHFVVPPPLPGLDGRQLELPSCGL